MIRIQSDQKSCHIDVHLLIHSSSQNNQKEKLEQKQKQNAKDNGIIQQKQQQLYDDGQLFTPSSSLFACHHTSHLLLWEEDSYNKLCGLDAVVIDTRDEAMEQQQQDNDGFYHIPPLSLKYVESTFLQQKQKQQNDASKFNQISTLIIELPHRELGGVLPSWEDDVVGIGKLCKEHGVKYHCDGARIFEASAGYG